MVAAVLAVFFSASYLAMPLLSNYLVVEAGRTCCNPNNMSQCDGCGSDETKNDNECNGASGCRNCGGNKSNSCCLPGECNPPQPPCDPANPIAPTLSSPTDKAADLPIPVTLVWTATTSWGRGCDDSKKYYLFMQEKTTATCPLTDYPVHGAAIAAASTSVAVSDIKWGTTYCWYVQANNNGYKANSDRREFTTSLPPTITNFKIIDATKCIVPSTANPAQISGRASNPDVNNPITIQMDIADPHNNFGTGKNVFESARIAVVTTQNQNSTTTPFTVLEPILRTRLGFKVSAPKVGTNTWLAATSASVPYFSTSATTGNVANANSTLLSLNSATNVQQVDNTTLRVTWQLRFEDVFITSADNIYATVVSRESNNVLISQDPNAGVNPLNYRKYLTWATDMQAPAASLTGPTATNPNTFTVNWSASDTATGNNGIRDLRSYCYVDEKATVMKNLNLGQDINLGTTPLQYPSASNCLVNTANLGKHTYQLTDLDNKSNVVFKEYAQDGACNVSVVTAQLNSPSAWVITADGTVSAGGGYTNFFIHNVATLSGIVPNLGADSFLSTYSAIAGTPFMVSQLQSKHKFYVTKYENRAMQPPEISGQKLWFDFMYQQAAARQTFVASGNGMSISGNMSSVFGVPVGTSTYRYIKGDVTIAPATFCDINAAIFVEGKLTINPDFKRANQQSGCVFVVKGDILMDKGSVKSPLVPSTTAPALYDTVEGAFITDGKFLTTTDQQSSGSSLYPGDGLYVRGIIYSGDIELHRNLGISQNGLQPAEAFDYDPYYARVFSSLFGIKSFSIRAQ